MNINHKAGFSNGYLALIENNRRKPSMENLKKIAKILNVPIEIFYILSCPLAFTIYSTDKELQKVLDGVQSLYKAQKDLGMILNDIS